MGSIRRVHLSTPASFGCLHSSNARIWQTRASSDARIRAKTRASSDARIRLARASSGACIQWRGHLQALDWGLSRRFPSWVSVLQSSMVLACRDDSLLNGFQFSRPSNIAACFKTSASSCRVHLKNTRRRVHLHDARIRATRASPRRAHQVNACIRSARVSPDAGIKTTRVSPRRAYVSTRASKDARIKRRGHPLARRGHRSTRAWGATRASLAHA